MCIFIYITSAKNEHCYISFDYLFDYAAVVFDQNQIKPWPRTKASLFIHNCNTQTSTLLKTAERKKNTLAELMEMWRLFVSLQNPCDSRMRFSFLICLKYHWTTNQFGWDDFFWIVHAYPTIKINYFFVVLSFWPQCFFSLIQYNLYIFTINRNI